MAGLDLEKLCSPLDGDAPSGEDLEYDPDYSNLEIIATRKAEQQVGDSVKPAEEPDWKAVHAAASGLFARTRDIRIAWHLGRAELALHGVIGLAQVLAMVARLSEDQWETLHPQLDADDDNDPTMRVNAVMQFADQTEILGPLRHAPLAESRMLGRFSLRDFRQAHGEDPVPEGSEAPNLATIAGAFTDMGAEAVTARAQAIDIAIEAGQKIEAVFAEKIGAASSPNLESLAGVLKEMRRMVADGMGDLGIDDAGDPDAENEEQPHVEGDVGSVAAAPKPNRGVGEISSRRDVVKALDAIIKYYTTHEPTSPLPLLLERSKRLVDADFMSIMKEIAPDGQHQARTILGAPDDND